MQDKARSALARVLNSSVNVRFIPNGLNLRLQTGEISLHRDREVWIRQIECALEIHGNLAVYLSGSFASPPHAILSIVRNLSP